MKTCLAFSICLLVAAASGFADAYFDARARSTPAIVDVISNLTLMMTGYLWFRHDCGEHRYRRGVLLGGAIILFAPLAIPYYLFRSRPAGARVRPLLRFLGLVAGVIAFSVIGMLAHELVDAVWT